LQRVVSEIGPRSGTLPHCSGGLWPPVL